MTKNRSVFSTWGVGLVSRRAAIAALAWALCISTVGADDSSPRALAEAGHWKQLRVLSEQVLAANPNDAESAYLMSRVDLAFGDLEAAVALAEKAVSLDDRNAAYHLQLALVSGTMASKAGMFRAFKLGGRYKAEIQRAIELDDKHADARVEFMYFYWNAPRIAGGDKNKARALANDILRVDPAQGYLAQTWIAERENGQDTAKLEGLYQQAILANPGDYQVRVRVARFYASDSVKKYDQAILQAREALKLDRRRSDAYALLAKIYSVRQAWQELDTVLREAERWNPDDLSPFYEAGRSLLQANSDLPRAESYFRKYLTQDPEAHKPDWAAAHRNLGLVLEKLGRRAEAVVELETAVRLRPNYEDARKDLKRLW